jgi:hypothetical protein
MGVKASWSNLTRYLRRSGARRRSKKSPPAPGEDVGSHALGEVGSPAQSNGGSHVQREGAPPRRCDEGLREQAPAKARWDASQMGRDERWRRRLSYLLDGWRPEPIPAHRRPVEDPCAGVVGICCSGGGIRSAAFNLGALQELQRSGALQRAQYLAAVSGGSYIAAAFTMVAKTWQSSDTPGDDSDPELLAAEAPFAPGSPEEQYLRNRSDYLAPDGMAKLYIGYRIVLGLLFNMLFISLPLFGATMLLGVFVFRHSFSVLVHCAATSSCTDRGVHLPLWCWLAPTALAALSALFGLIVMLLRIPSETGRRVLQVWSVRLLLSAVLLALITVALPELVALLHVHGSGSGSATGTNTVKPAAAATVGLAGLLAGIVAQLRELFADTEKALSSLQKLSAAARRAIAYIAAAIVGPLFLYGVMVFSLSLTLANSLTESERWWLIGGGAGALLLFAALYNLADLSSWSLNPFYKRQLCTAFALKRVLPEHPADEQQREHGIAVEREYNEMVRLSDTALEAHGWPTLLVCAAANVSDPGATPPGRHVTSFTFSAHTIGGPLVGAIKTTAFEQVLDGNARRRRDLTLPAAVAMSGAAIAPSMGKMTKRPLTFLMALANIRLGVWVPNPRWVEGLHKRGLWRRPRPSYLIRELLGRNRVNGRYLFVTDGGHYENLGLVELLRRGCTAIYCFDASGGETFSELGDAVALARSELGVEIKIDPTSLMPSPAKAEGSTQADPAQEDGIAPKSVIEARFTYEDGTPGVLIYARNVMTGEAPWDVKAHHREDPSFPHNSTADQLYTDQKFESYRALGAQAGVDAVALMESAEAAVQKSDA